MVSAMEDIAVFELFRMSCPAGLVCNHGREAGLAVAGPLLWSDRLLGWPAISLPMHVAVLCPTLG